MQAAGYETGFLGKWHMGNDPTPRPGFDYWAAFPGQGRTIDPDIFEAGRLHRVEGYITDLLTDRAVDFIDTERNAPFMLYVGHKAVHPDALEGKPALRRSLNLRDSPAMAEEFAFMLDYGTSEETIRRRAEMVLSVDESLGRLIDALESNDDLDNTLIMFTSDNGFFFGEHWLCQERRLPYEESVRMPLLVRYPPLAKAGSKIEGLALSIDIAPTVLDVGGAAIGDHIHGRSLVPLLQGEATDWRESALIEFYTHENPRPWLMDMDYRAVRTDRYKLIHWIQHPGEQELYDLREDPYEMHNLIDDPQARDIVDELQAELTRLVVRAMGLTR